MPFFGFGLQYRVIIPKQIHVTTAKGEKIVGSFVKNAKTSNVREPLGLSTEELTAIRKAEQKALGKKSAKVAPVKQLVADPADGSFLGTYVFKNGASEVMKIKLSTPAVKRLTSAWANLQFHTDQECWYLPPPLQQPPPLLQPLKQGSRPHHTHPQQVPFHFSATHPHL